MIYKLEVEYSLEQFVYVITDPDQYRRLITGYYVNVIGAIMYEVSFGSSNARYYAAELADVKNYAL